MIIKPYKNFWWNRSALSGGGAATYKYYRFNFTAWNGGTGSRSLSEIALYDSVSNFQGLGIGNGELDVHSSSGIATGFDSRFGEVPSRAASGAIGDPANRWTADLGNWWQFAFTTNPTNPIVGYTLWSGNAALKYPKDWTLEGSDDESNWTVLDTRDTEIAADTPATYAPKNYEFGVPTPP